jgi:hypothetical protein
MMTVMLIAAVTLVTVAWLITAALPARDDVPLPSELAAIVKLWRQNHPDAARLVAELAPADRALVCQALGDYRGGQQ